MAKASNKPTETQIICARVSLLNLIEAGNVPTVLVVYAGDITKRLKVLCSVTAGGRTYVTDITHKVATACGKNPRIISGKTLIELRGSGMAAQDEIAGMIRTALNLDAMPSIDRITL